MANMNIVATGDTIKASDHNVIVQNLTGVGGQLLTTTAKGANIASAATLTLGTDGNYFQVTGTTGITGISSAPAGTEIILEFQGALLLTHNGTSLILRGATNYTTVAGDVLRFISEGGGNWRQSSIVGTTGAAGGVLTGTYPNPTLAAASIVLIYNAAGVIVLQPSSDPAAATQMIQVKNNAGTVKFAVRADGSLVFSDATVQTTAGAPAITTATNNLAADTVLTNANTYYDGPSISLVAGTWLVTGTVTCEDPGSGGGVLTAKLWDGTTTAASTEVQVAAGLTGSLSMSAIVTPGGTTTYKISVARTVANGRITATASSNGAGATASHIRAIKVA